MSGRLFLVLIASLVVVASQVIHEEKEKSTDPRYQWNYLQPGLSNPPIQQINNGVRPAYSYDNVFPDQVNFQQPATFNGVIQPFPSVGLPPIDGNQDFYKSGNKTVEKSEKIE